MLSLKWSMPDMMMRMKMVYELALQEVDSGYTVQATGYTSGGKQILQFTPAKTPATALSKARRDIGRLENALTRMKL